MLGDLIECACGDPERNIPPCGVIGKELRTGHARGCKCGSCKGRRNQRAGKRTEALSHKRLGGTGPTPSDESPLVRTVKVIRQVKSGAQVPANFVKFTQLDWTRRAFHQAEVIIPIGVEAFPAVDIFVPGDGEYLVVKIA